MTKIIDVAEYILDETGPITAMKLQKLIYYCQAWHLAWTEKVLFEDRIEAWRNGPVVKTLFDLHKGHLKIESGFFANKMKPKMTNSLSQDEKDVIRRVIKYYGNKDPHWLSQLTHMEDPWKLARAKSSSSIDDSSSEEITIDSMFEYYSSL